MSRGPTASHAASRPSTPTDHPLWSEFHRWYKANYSVGGLSQVDMWEAYVAGARAVGYGQATTKLIVNGPPPATPPAGGPIQARDRFASLADADLLKEVVDGTSPDSRTEAMALLTERIRAGCCCPKVALVKGFLQRVNLKDSTQDSRRTVARMAVDKYSLELKLWY